LNRKISKKALKKVKNLTNTISAVIEKNKKLKKEIAKKKK